MYRNNILLFSWVLAVFSIFSVSFLVTYSDMSVLESVSIFLYYNIFSLFLMVFFFSKKRKEEKKYSNPRIIVLVSFIIFISLGAVAYIASDDWWRYHAWDTVSGVLQGKLSPDTPYHAAIINSIARVGYPSTGLNGDLFFPYHVATHYFDAAFSLVFEKNALDVYGATSFVKTIGAISIIGLFCMRFVKSENWLDILLFFFVCTTLLFYGGFFVGSHSLWLPSVLLIVAWSLLEKPLGGKPNLLTMLSLCVIGIILALGKISLGLPFMAIIGLSLFFRYPLNPIIISLGIVWVSFLLYSSSFYVGRVSSKNVIDLYYYISVYKGSLFVFLFCVIFAFVNIEGWCRKVIFPMLIFLSFILATSWSFTNKPEDWGYFSLGFMFVGSVFLLTDVGSSLGKGATFNPTIERLASSIWACVLPKRATHYLVGLKSKVWNRNLELSKINTYKAVIFIVIILISWIFARFPIIGVDHLVNINEYPFKIYNLNRPNKRDIIQDIKDGIDFSTYQNSLNEEIEMRKFRSAMSMYYQKKGIESKVPLFLSEAIWDGVQNRVPGYLTNKQTRKYFKTSNEWLTALSISAFLGRPLVHAVPEERPAFYGYSYYAKNVKRVKSHKEVNCADFPIFVRVKSLDDNEFELVSCR